MPRTMIMTVVDEDGKPVWPTDDPTPEPASRSSARRRPTSSPTSSPATPNEGQPVLGRWAIYERQGRRPAAYKTGTTNDNRDVHAYGYLAPPKDPERPGAGGRRLDGQQQQRPEHRQPLARLVRAAVVGDPDARSARTCRSPTSRRPPGLADRDGRRVHRPRPARSRRRPSRSSSSRAPCRRERDNYPDRRVDDRRGERPALAGGLRRAEGDQRGFLDFGEAESDPQGWQKANRGWAARAAQGRGVSGRPRGHPDRVLLRRRLPPVRRAWGGAVRADARYARWPAAEPPACAGSVSLPPDPSDPVADDHPRPRTGTATAAAPIKPPKTPKP